MVSLDDKIPVTQVYKQKKNEKGLIIKSLHLKLKPAASLT